MVRAEAARSQDRDYQLTVKYANSSERAWMRAAWLGWKLPALLQTETPSSTPRASCEDQGQVPQAAAVVAVAQALAAAAAAAGPGPGLGPGPAARPPGAREGGEMRSMDWSRLSTSGKATTLTNLKSRHR